MSWQFLKLFSILLLSVGCAQFETGRSYLSEMQDDDTRFFSPKTDFPIVAGDTGRYWNTESEQLRRTPASPLDEIEMKRARLLERELADLEMAQTSEALKFYEKYQHRLVTTSEKIYFLELPPHERREYLTARGFIEETKRPSFSHLDRSIAVEKSDILYGMKKNDVVASWGQPLQVDVAGDPRNENERWLYKSNGASKYIYFESGEVQGWE